MNRHLRSLVPVVGLIACIAIAIVEPCQALDIEFSYFDGFENRPAARAAMEQAATIWEQALSDPVTVRIDVYEFDEPDSDDLLGGTAPTYDSIDYTYADLRAALSSDATSPDDILAVANLQPGPRLALRTWDADQNAIVRDGDEWINKYVSPVRATAKALGLPYGINGPDAEISWNTAFLDDGFDFDRSDGIVRLDFVGTTVHEIAHALGFNSGVDGVDAVFAGEIPIPPSFLNDLPIVEPLDLFRYTAESLPHSDLVPGGGPYFSIDGGVTNLMSFASGEFFGNGDQASHWGELGGVMFGIQQDDVIENLTAVDIRAMDVIGWDLAATVVPEPSSLWLATLALTAIGARWR